MRHDPDFSARHPITPLRDCSPRIQAMFGYKAPKRVTTRDGRLACTCGKSTGCTCRPTRDAAPAPEKPRISQAAALTAGHGSEASERPS